VQPIVSSVAWQTGQSSSRVGKATGALGSERLSDAVEGTSWYSVSHMTAGHSVDPTTEPHTGQITVDSVSTSTHTQLRPEVTDVFQLRHLKDTAKDAERAISSSR